jgi:predicted amidohydrolase YtcJ
VSILLRRARLVGGDAEPVDVLVRDGRIAAIGADASSAYAGSALTDPTSTETGAPAPAVDEVVDLDGRYLGPGLWDHHVHFSQWALTRQRIDVEPATSAAHAASIVRGRIDGIGYESSELVTGYGFRAATWPDAPSLEVLDAVSAVRPIALISGDLHAVWLNSPALDRFGFAGHPTGLLREDDAFAVSRRMSSVDDAVLDGWVREAAVAAASRGVVGVGEFEMAPNLDAWVRRVRSGTTSLRVRASVYREHLDAAIGRGLRTGDPLPGSLGLVRLGQFKIIIDGSLNTRTAYCHDPYAGTPGGAHPGSGPDAASAASTSDSGFSTVPFEDLVELLERASAAGVEPAVHAIGDRANGLALDAFARAGCGGSIEHAQLLSREDLGRFAALGVLASMQPEHAMDDRDVADRLWAGRTDRAFALESLLAAGARLRLGSDAPVAPLDPWVSIAAAVGRTRDGREPWHPEQRIPRRAAYAASLDDRAGHPASGGFLRDGDVADLAVTELDPLTAGGDELRRMPVAATLLEGRFTHRAI